MSIIKTLVRGRAGLGARTGSSVAKWARRLLPAALLSIGCEQVAPAMRDAVDEPSNPPIVRADAGADAAHEDAHVQPDARAVDAAVDAAPDATVGPARPCPVVTIRENARGEVEEIIHEQDPNGRPVVLDFGALLESGEPAIIHGNYQTIENPPADDTRIRPMVSADVIATLVLHVGSQAPADTYFTLNFNAFADPDNAPELRLPLFGPLRMEGGPIGYSILLGAESPDDFIRANTYMCAFPALRRLIDNVFLDEAPITREYLAGVYRRELSDQLGTLSLAEYQACALQGRMTPALTQGIANGRFPGIAQAESPDQIVAHHTQIARAVSNGNEGDFVLVYTNAEQPLCYAVRMQAGPEQVVVEFYRTLKQLIDFELR